MSRGLGAPWLNLGSGAVKQGDNAAEQTEPGLLKCLSSLLDWGILLCEHTVHSVPGAPGAVNGVRSMNKPVSDLSASAMHWGEHTGAALSCPVVSLLLAIQ